MPVKVPVGEPPPISWVLSVRVGDEAPLVVEGPGGAELAELERRHVLAVVWLVGGNRTRAALALGIDRRTLHRKLARYRARAKAWP